MKHNLGIGYGKVLEGLDFGGIWPHALSSEHCAIEGSVRLPDLAVSVVEEKCHAHGLSASAARGVSHAPWGVAVDAYISMNCNFAR